jgi:hypothetical protein
MPNGMLYVVISWSLITAIAAMVRKGAIYHVTGSEPDRNISKEYGGTKCFQKVAEFVQAVDTAKTPDEHTTPIPICLFLLPISGKS